MLRKGRGLHWVSNQCVQVSWYASGSSSVDSMFVSVAGLAVPVVAAAQSVLVAVTATYAVVMAASMQLSPPAPRDRCTDRIRRGRAAAVWTEPD